MEAFKTPKTKFRFIVCSDVDAMSATKLSEKYVRNDPEIDAIIVQGPFTDGGFKTKEDEATAIGDVATILAQLESLVCRVVYLATERDPVDTVVNQAHLTPNSINIHGRGLDLAQHLQILGFAEKSEILAQTNVAEQLDKGHETLELLENVEVASATSASIIQEMLRNSGIEVVHPILAANPLEESGENDEYDSGSGELGRQFVRTVQPTSLFVLNYHYSHTLNRLLFHMTADLTAARVALLIVSSENCPETDRLPARFGNFHIIAPKSLRKTGYYHTFDLEYDAANQGWTVTNVQVLHSDL